MSASLVSKLQLKPGQSLTLLGTPQGLAEYLAAEMPDLALGEHAEPDAMLAFVTSKADAVHLAQQAFSRVAAGGLAWIAYPKMSSGVATDLNRDSLWEALMQTGWRPVRQIALDDTWSAIRFRPSDEVGR